MSLLSPKELHEAVLGRLPRTDRDHMEKLSRVVWDTVWLSLDAEPGIGGEVSSYIAQKTADAFEQAYREQFEVGS